MYLGTPLKNTVRTLIGVLSSLILHSNLLKPPYRLGRLIRVARDMNIKRLFIALPESSACLNGFFRSQNPALLLIAIAFRVKAISFHFDAEFVVLKTWNPLETPSLLMMLNVTCHGIGSFFPARVRVEIPMYGKTSFLSVGKSARTRVLSPQAP